MDSRRGRRQGVGSLALPSGEQRSSWMTTVALGAMLLLGLQCLCVPMVAHAFRERVTASQPVTPFAKPRFVYTSKEEGRTIIPLPANLRKQLGDEQVCVRIVELESQLCGQIQDAVHLSVYVPHTLLHAVLQSRSSDRAISLQWHVRRARAGEAAAIAWLDMDEPPYGAIVRAGVLPIQVTPRGFNISSPDVVVALQASGHDIPLYLPGRQLPEQDYTMSIKPAEPGSLTVRVVPLLATPTGEMVGGVPTDLYVEAVLEAEEIEQHRVFPDLSTPPPDQALLLRDHETRTEGAEPATRTRLCFVGSLNLDGQKTIWLEQFRRLPRDRFDITVLSFVTGEDGPLVPLVQAIPDVTFARHRLTSVTQEELEATLGEERAAQLADTPDDIYNEILRGLYNAEWDPNKLSIEWVSRAVQPLVEILSAQRPDILVFANGRQESDLLLLAAAKVIGVRNVVIDLPNLFPQHGMFEPFVTVVSPSTYALQHASVQEAIQFGGLQNIWETSGSVGGLSNAVVIPPGIDTDHFSPKGDVVCHPLCREPGTTDRCSDGCHVVGFMARFAPEKSPLLFLRAAAVMAKSWPSLRFQVMGDGELREIMEITARELGIYDRVHFTGWVSNSELPKYMRGIDLMVNPSLRAWSETFCIANIEAMSCGVPVLTFGVGGVGEYAAHLRERIPADLFIMDEPFPEKIAAQALRLVRDPQLRAELGHHCRQVVLEGFTIQSFVSKYSALYSNLASGTHT